MFEELLRKLRPEIKDVARDVQDLDRRIENLEYQVAELIRDAELQRSPDKGGDWLCKNCNCANLPVDNACTSCGTPRPRG